MRDEDDMTLSLFGRLGVDWEVEDGDLSGRRDRGDGASIVVQTLVEQVC